MQRCAECNRYNLFDSKGRTDKINFLVTKGYKKSTLDRLCIDCINKEYNKVKERELTFKSLEFIANAQEAKNSELYKKYSSEDITPVVNWFEDEYINKYF